MIKDKDVVRLAKILCELNNEDPNQEFFNDEIREHHGAFVRWETRYDRAKELLIEHEAMSRLTTT